MSSAPTPAPAAASDWLEQMQEADARFFALCKAAETLPDLEWAEERAYLESISAINLVQETLAAEAREAAAVKQKAAAAAASIWYVLA